MTRISWGTVDFNKILKKYDFNDILNRWVCDYTNLILKMQSCLKFQGFRLIFKINLTVWFRPDLRVTNSYFFTSPTYINVSVLYSEDFRMRCVRKLSQLHFSRFWIKCHHSLQQGIFITPVLSYRYFWLAWCPLYTSEEMSISFHWIHNLLLSLISDKRKENGKTPIFHIICSNSWKYLMKNLNSYIYCCLICGFSSLSVQFHWC